MNSIAEISAVLRAALGRTKVSQQELRTSAGVSRQTLANVLKGTVDFKLSTLLGIADRLGLELVLVPKGAGRGLAGSPESAPVVETLVDHVRKGLGPLRTTAPGTPDGEQE